MLDKGKNIDSIFKDGLNNICMPPQPDIWNKISSSLDESQNKRRAIIWWQRGAAAAIIGLIATTILYLTQQTHSTSLYTVNSPVYKNTTIQPATTSKHKTPIQKVEMQTPTERQNQNNSVVFVASSKRKPVQTFKSVTEKNNLQPLSKIKSQSIIKLSSPQQPKFSQLVTSNQKRASIPFNLYSNAYQTSDIKPKKSKTKILLAGSVSPSYSSNQSSGGGSQSNVDFNTDPFFESSNRTSPKMEESGITSMSGGFNLRIENDKRWSFETGIHYSKVGQSTKTPTPVIRNTANHEYAEANILQQISLNNSMGRIKLDNQNILMDNASFNSPDTKYLLTANNLHYSSTNIKQTLEYIEIPLTLRYKLIDGFTSVSLAGGLSSNFLVDNNAYLVDGSKSTKIGETGDIKPIVFSSSLGIGFELPIGQSFRFTLEPKLKYFLNSVNSDSDYSYQPLSLGVFGGIILIIN